MVERQEEEEGIENGLNDPAVKRDVSVVVEDTTVCIEEVVMDDDDTAEVVSGNMDDIAEEEEEEEEEVVVGTSPVPDEYKHNYDELTVTGTNPYSGLPSLAVFFK